ncbi:uncharacterized protein KY384_002171 [Bacidia gigantensis]|uniref:uncharacterized protein n=1 Tax=Bacidia gigantensis TaxID=2732470 RepID=UPI001D03D573|nr:uncharacterized protein KY384_002171 [Bacidia gigantensis]KAG8533388.1 hypothetical protein KY384_002171 [Bacidia gigantensis]
MPATRVTVIVNTEQTQKTILLVPASISYDPCVSPSCHSLVTKIAQTKLRLKKPCRIFARGGQELVTTENWQDAIRNDATLLVSTGEDYVGARTEVSDSSRTREAGGASRDCPVIQLNGQTEVDSLSLTQLETTARSLPGILHAVAQPDLHPGTKYPIGGVLVSKGWIHPPLIGSDIGCGMAWYKTSLSRSQVEGDKGRKVAEKLRGLEGPWRSHAEQVTWLGQVGGAGQKWDASLGTIGAGNHFAELQVVEESSPGHGEAGTTSSTELSENDVILLVHSGSRGYGGDILKRHTGNGRDSIPESEAGDYLQEHDHACQWAERNRDLIALRFLSILEPGQESWSPGKNEPGQPVASDEICHSYTEIQKRKVVDIWHNNIERTLWPPSNPHAISEGQEQQQTAYIHRKGAAPTYHPSTRQPLNILPLPGSRATPTIILHPTFSTTNDFGRVNALSLAHGAGRARSRADAATHVAEKYKGRADDLLRGDFVRADRHGNKKVDDGQGRDIKGGTWVVCEDKQLVWEEASEAYKDVWKVAGDLVAKGCAERWGWCRGRVSYKVRKE